MPAAGPQNTRAKQRPRVAKPPRPAKIVTDIGTGGAHQMQVAARARHTRKFYDAMVEASYANPETKSAARALRTGQLSHSQQRIAAQSPYLLRSMRGRQAVARTALDTAVHTGPDKVAKEAFGAYLHRLWKRVGHDYGGTQPHGRVYSGAGKFADYAAYVNVPGDTVHYEKQTLRDFESSYDRYGRDYAKSVPLHEWQHTRQRKGDEGEAEYVRKKVSAEVGIPWHPANFEYESKRRAYTIRRARKKAKR